MLWHERINNSNTELCVGRAMAIRVDGLALKCNTCIKQSAQSSAFCGPKVRHLDGDEETNQPTTEASSISEARRSLAHSMYRGRKVGPRHALIAG